MRERGISCAFASEIWEKSEKKEHILEIERMLEIDGLKYLWPIKMQENYSLLFLLHAHFPGSLRPIIPVSVR